jgi:hypothetical protein
MLLGVASASAITVSLQNDNHWEEDRGDYNVDTRWSFGVFEAGQCNNAGTPICTIATTSSAPNSQTCGPFDPATTYCIRKAWNGNYESGPNTDSIYHGGLQEDVHDKAVEVTKGNDAVQSFIEQAPDYDVNTRTPTSAEINEYPVIYQDTQEPVLVQYSHQSQGLLCVVDNDEVIRCFNNIDIG